MKCGRCARLRDAGPERLRVAKAHSIYICQACEARFPRWLGQCPACGQWNTLEEALARPEQRQARQVRTASAITMRMLGELKEQAVPRLRSSIGEWDRVLGDGIVPGSVVLVGGDPGVGKSTLVMQAADAIATDRLVLYVSGEESLAQVGLRARRLGLRPNGMHLAAETDLNVIISSAESERPAVLVVDSIQSVYDPALEAAPGSVTQLRECTFRLHEVAKRCDVAVVLIGHVTKEGVLAGPKLLEHMVDAVLYLEGERLQAYRLLRSVKNRYGATSEVGVFEMLQEGMREVSNPSAAFLADRVGGGAGSVIVVTVEGTRPMLAEIQALVTRTALSIPRRMTSGVDFNRVVLLAAVLSKRGGVPMHDFDIHVNVVGGLRIEEPAADLGTALAMLSSFRDAPVDPETVAIGEVGLAGELRGVGQMELRLREAAKLGFRRAIVPSRVNESIGFQAGIEIIRAATVREAAVRAGVQ
ncbi:MAG: repair protein RadA [Chloroflexi bacterium]|nr:repair protein RadA [Chloroflexota bacterium]